MAEAATLERDALRLSIAPLATALPRATVLRLDPEAPSERLPGELLCADEWHEVAALLDLVAASIPRRMRRHGRFSDALASFAAHEVRQVAAEIRANLALEERDACMKACRHD